MKLDELSKEKLTNPSEVSEFYTFTFITNRFIAII